MSRLREQARRQREFADKRVSQARQAMEAAKAAGDKWAFDFNYNVWLMASRDRAMYAAQEA